MNHQCGSEGVDEDGHCKRCGLVPEPDTECPRGFFAKETRAPRTPLDRARDALFAASRVLQKAHEYRLRTFKSDMAAVQACRDADRELQRAAVRFTAALVASHPAPGPMVAELVLGVVEAIK